jgi:hypothetical protein
MNVLITGAAGGLGRALAIECAERGFSLILTDVNADGLHSIRNGIIRQYNVSVIIISCNLTDNNDISALMEKIKEDKISVDMLLNVAGVDYEGGFVERDCNNISNIIRLNIEATLRITHFILSIKKPYKRLYIVFVSSLASMYPMPLKATYAASKRFLLDFSVALRQELKAYNVSVLSVCPAGLPTTQEALRGIDAQGFWGKVTTNHLERFAKRTILYSLNNKSVYIPGALNKTFCYLGFLIPNSLIAGIIYKRWSKAQKKWLENL